MSFDFRPSISEDINKAPLIAIAGPTGCGKTESAMRLARGFCGPDKKFCIIDTEERRALYKKARYQPWDHLDLKAPFSTERYVEALDAARTAGYAAVIIDSWSHAWDGEGGASEQAEDAIEAMVQKMGAAKAEKLTPLAWKEPKRKIKRVVSRVAIRFPVLLIFCLRAEPKIKFVKEIVDGRPKTSIIDAGFQPICEKSFMFDMLVACKMESYELNGTPGLPIHIKKLELELESVFLSGKQIDESTGARLAAWSREHGKPGDPKRPLPSEAGFITGAEWQRMGKIGRAAGHRDEDVKTWLRNQHRATSAETLKRDDYQAICDRLADRAELDLATPPPDDARE